MTYHHHVSCHHHVIYCITVLNSLRLLQSAMSQANMLALWSFGPAIFRELGREQFLAVYASAAVVASLASHLWTVCIAEAPRSSPASRPTLYNCRHKLQDTHMHSVDMCCGSVDWITPMASGLVQAHMMVASIGFLTVSAT